MVSAILYFEAKFWSTWVVSVRKNMKSCLLKAIPPLIDKELEGEKKHSCFLTYKKKSSFLSIPRISVNT